jgi:ribosome recycling factor
MMPKIIQDAESRMQKSLDKFRSDLMSVRTGKASPAILEAVQVEYYGSQLPLSQVASISAPEPRLLVVQAWDKAAVQGIVKGIQAADLGLNPAEDGEIVRVPIPALTEERRQEIAKRVRKMAEEVKVSVRNVRRDANEALAKAEKKKEISEDELRRGEKDVQKLTDDMIAKVDQAAKAKEKEILEV